MFSTIAFANPNAREGGVRLPEAAFLRRIDGRLVPIANQSTSRNRPVLTSG